MKDAGLAAVYKLQATGQGSFTKDPEAYVLVIAEAVLALVPDPGRVSFGPLDVGLTIGASNE